MIFQFSSLKSKPSFSCIFISFFLSFSLVFLGAIPRTNTFLDDFFRPASASATPLVAAPIIFGTALAVLGIGVAGTSVADYNGNLDKAYNDFLASSGKTAKEFDALLLSSVLPLGALDGRILSSIISLLTPWAASLHLSSSPSSLVVSSGSLTFSGYTLPINYSDDLTFGKSYTLPSLVLLCSANDSLQTYTPISGIASSSPDRTIFCKWPSSLPSNYPYFEFSSNSSFSVGVSAGEKSWREFSGSSVLVLPRAFSSLNFSPGVSFIFYDSSGTLVGNLSSSGVWSAASAGSSAAFSGSGGFLDGALSGALEGGALLGGTDLSSLSPNVDVWNPSASDLADGYTSADVVTKTGAWGDSAVIGGDITADNPLDALKQLWNHLGATLAGIPGLIAKALQVLFAPLTLIFELLKSLGLFDWLSKVWDWICSLDLVKWLVKVWDWICSLDLAGWFAGLLAAVLNFPKFAWDGLAAILLSSFSLFFLPTPGKLDSLIFGIKQDFLDKFGIDFDLKTLVGSEKFIDKQYATFNFGGHSFTVPVFDPSPLVDAIVLARPFLRGFSVVLLLFFIVDQVLRLLGSGGIFSRIAGKDE